MILAISITEYSFWQVLQRELVKSIFCYGSNGMILFYHDLGCHVTCFPKKDHLLCIATKGMMESKFGRGSNGILYVLFLIHVYTELRKGSIMTSLMM